MKTKRGPTALFTLTGIPDHAKLKLYASLECAAKTWHTASFLKQNGISLQIKEDDIQLASIGTLTKFIYLPHRKPSEKWSGHLGTLTMGGVTTDQYELVLKNLKRLGFLLAVFQLGNRFPNDGIPVLVPSKESDGQTEPSPRTTRKRDVQRGSQAKEIPFRIRSRKFRNEDDVTIESFVELDPKQKSHRYEVRGRYRLQSRPAAILEQWCANGKVRGNKRIKIKKGEGTFRFTFSVFKNGKLHISYYPKNGGDSFGSIYYEPTQGALREEQPPRKPSSSDRFDSN
jgi:hypothetical protein